MSVEKFYFGLENGENLSWIFMVCGRIEKQFSNIKLTIGFVWEKSESELGKLRWWSNFHSSANRTVHTIKLFNCCLISKSYNFSIEFITVVPQREKIRKENKLWKTAKHKMHRRSFNRNVFDNEMKKSEIVVNKKEREKKLNTKLNSK